MTRIGLKTVSRSREERAIDELPDLTDQADHSSVLLIAVGNNVCAIRIVESRHRFADIAGLRRNTAGSG